MAHDSRVSWSFCVPNARGAALAFAIVFGVLVLTAGCGSGGGTQSSAPPANQFTNFDAPGAGQTSPQGTLATAISPNGDTAGYFIDSSGTLHGFIRSSAGTITSVDAPGAGTGNDLGTLVIAINSSGEAVGSYFDPQDVEHSFIRSSSGTITEFDPPGAFGSGAGAISDSGTVGGGYRDGSGAHGFLRSATGTFTTFDPTGVPSEVQIVVPEMSANATVAGTYTDTGGVYHGFLMNSDGTITILDAPGAGTASDEGTEITDVNSSGLLVGAIYVGIVNGVDTSHSFTRAADGTYTMFDPPEAVSSFADGINDSGAVVGTYRKADLVRHGYVRDANGTFTTLDDPDAAQVQYTYTNLGTAPQHINASGVVVGLFSDTAAVRHAFIWQ
jgi:hypothetical protein